MKLYENYWVKKKVRFGKKEIEDDNMRPRRGYGRKDGSRSGWNKGGRGRNRTDECRHPEKRRRRR